VTENGYFTDFELIFGGEDGPTFLAVPWANCGRGVENFGFSSCAASRSVLGDIPS